MDDQYHRPISPTTLCAPESSQVTLQQDGGGPPRPGALKRVFSSMVPRYRTITHPPEVTGDFIMRLPRCMSSPFVSQPTRSNPQRYLFHSGPTHDHHVKLITAIAPPWDKAPSEYVPKPKSQRIRIQKEPRYPDTLYTPPKPGRSSMVESMVDDDPKSPTLSATTAFGSSIGPGNFESAKRTEAELLRQERENDTFRATVENKQAQGGIKKSSKPWVELGKGSGHMLRIVAIERSHLECPRCEATRKKFKQELWNSHKERYEGVTFDDHKPQFDLALVGIQRTVTRPASGKQDTGTVAQGSNLLNARNETRKEVHDESPGEKVSTDGKGITLTVPNYSVEEPLKELVTHPLSPPPTPPTDGHVKIPRPHSPMDIGHLKEIRVETGVLRALSLSKNPVNGNIVSPPSQMVAVGAESTPSMIEVNNA